MLIAAVSFLAAGMLWFAGCVYYRGSPSCGNKMSFTLMFLAPIGSLIFAGAAFICLLKR
jgi:hypothetical protein